MDNHTTTTTSKVCGVNVDGRQFTGVTSVSKCPRKSINGKKPKHDRSGEEHQGGFGFLSHCGSQMNTVAYQQDQVPHALRENPSYQLQYLNCTLTVSSNKHVGLPIWKCPPAHGAHKLICVIFFPVLVQDTFDCIKLECQQCL